MTGFVIGLVAGALLAAGVTWALLRQTYAARRAALGTERDLLRERVIDLESAVADDQQTAAVLAPLSATLGRVEKQVATLERDRVEQFGELGARLAEVGRVAGALHQETTQLSGALRATSTGGTWGEVQLRRVLEHSGMLAHCDFEEQVTAVSRHDATIRPDVVVRLPAGRVLVIDSKAPTRAFLDAQADHLTPVDRDRLLDQHAKALVRHVDALAAKAYWSAFEQSPQLVVCFVPADAMLAAALRQDPSLLDRAMSRKVVPASPSTLLALLRTSAAAWQQDSLARGARELLALGQTLYDRLGTMGRHTAKVGQSLTRSVEAYNAMIGTLESRVLVTARQMHALGLAQDAPPERLRAVETPARPLTAHELIDALDEDVARPTLDFRDPATRPGDADVPDAG
ncbi:DNA recombination protein RmuC [Flexivirga oryzae]|uniref:DNA recombination protein RmuC n=1 Tax=Flexivirga oryzae TaxID=1794944 RepID=A0A839NFG6_9MICO|nr:DNA recombination protein RmuC [Flexivirga oryzae]MBB2894366.1 DNA recombination protein RmuC [Flexivirga oryzae]